MIGAAGLLAGFIAIATLIDQSNQLTNVCKSVSIFIYHLKSRLFFTLFVYQIFIYIVFIDTQAKGVGNTALARTLTTNLPNNNAAEITARLNLIEDAINAFSTPDCRA